MHPEIEKLIDLAVTDGQITEKERNVILKKAAEFGVDAEEVEMVIEAKKHLHEKNTIGTQIKCPACGNRISGLAKTCSCGYVFNTGALNESKSLEASIETLENLIVQVRSLSSSSPKEVIESLIAKVEKEIRYIKTRYADNVQVNGLLSELEEISDLHINKSRKKLKIRRVFSISLIVLLSLFVAYVLIKIITKKSKNELFVEQINNIYLDKYTTYKQSKEYQDDLNRFNTFFYECRLATVFTEEWLGDSLSSKWDEWENAKNISEFYFTANAAACIYKNDIKNAELFLDTALVLNPKFSPIYYYKSKLYENSDSIIKFLSTAIQLDSKSSFIYLPFRSDAYYANGNLRKSLNDIETYLREYPNDRPIDLARFFWCVSVKYDLGLKKEACTEFNKLDLSQKKKIEIRFKDSYDMLIQNCKN